MVLFYVRVLPSRFSSSVGQYFADPTINTCLFRIFLVLLLFSDISLEEEEDFLSFSAYPSISADLATELDLVTLTALLQCMQILIV